LKDESKLNLPNQSENLFLSSPNVIRRSRKSKAEESQYDNSSHMVMQSNYENVEEISPDQILEAKDSVDLTE